MSCAKRLFENKTYKYDFQLLFTAIYSKSPALLVIVDYIYNHVDNYDYIAGIYLDLQKSFNAYSSNINMKVA